MAATIEAMAYEALITNTALVAKLAKKIDGKTPAIYGDRAPDSGKYPCLVYTSISDVPTDYADDQLTAHRNTIRVTLITTDGITNPIVALIKSAMEGAGFRWSQTYPYNDDETICKVIQFVYGEWVADF